MSRAANIHYKCPQCGVDSIGTTAKVAGSSGKKCANGHFYTYYELRVFRETGVVPKRKEKPVSARNTLAQMGVGERTTQLTVALQWMLHSYDVMMAALPAGSQAHALAVGAFGKKPELCREVLG